MDIIVITVTINRIMIVIKIISITILLTIVVSTNRIISIDSIGIRIHRIISKSLMTVLLQLKRVINIIIIHIISLTNINVIIIYYFFY